MAQDLNLEARLILKSICVINILCRKQTAVYFEDRIGRTKVGQQRNQSDLFYRLEFRGPFCQRHFKNRYMYITCCSLS